MSKQYGLIIPGQQKKPQVVSAPSDKQKSSIFDEESSSDDNAPQLKPRSGKQSGPSVMERRLARQTQEKALLEDPTVFQYDELYDEMENQRVEKTAIKSKEPKKPKYITKLLETAERRKLENELRVERQVQKEREAEGEEFKDKESFVTSAYRKKLEEIRQQEEREKREEYLEAIGDVTKQKDLDGFYRHLYEQKMGATKETPATTNTVDEEISYKPIKSGKPQQARAYRKRQSTDEEEDSNSKDENNAPDSKKVHLSNNIDADSDFSIDSSSSDDEDSDNNECSKNIDKERKDNSKQVQVKTEKLDKENVNTNPIEKSSTVEVEKSDEKIEVTESKPVLPKPKKDVWKKRTVGEVFDAALQRYYERKASRNA